MDKKESGVFSRSPAQPRLSTDSIITPWPLDNKSINYKKSRSPVNQPTMVILCLPPTTTPPNPFSDETYHSFSSINHEPLATWQVGHPPASLWANRWGDRMAPMDLPIMFPLSNNKNLQRLEGTYRHKACFIPSEILYLWKEPSWSFIIYLPGTHWWTVYINNMSTWLRPFWFITPLDRWFHHDGRLFIGAARHLAAPAPVSWMILFTTY